mgnify:CR=1 FL=1
MATAAGGMSDRHDFSISHSLDHLNVTVECSCGRRKTFDRLSIRPPAGLNNMAHVFNLLHRDEMLDCYIVAGLIDAEP